MDEEKEEFEIEELDLQLAWGECRFKDIEDKINEIIRKINSRE